MEDLKSAHYSGRIVVCAIVAARFWISKNRAMADLYMHVRKAIKRGNLKKTAN